VEASQPAATGVFYHAAYAPVVSRFKIDHDTAGGETVASFARFYRATASCQHNALFFRKFINDFFFTVTETLFAFYIEDPAHISSGSFLNLLIRIVKFHIELLS